MKHLPIVLTVLLLAGSLSMAFADNPAGMIKLENFDLPVATTDGLYAPLINPALLGVGRAGGIGWSHLNDEEKWQRHYWFTANLDGLSYVYEHNDGIDHHSFAMGSEIFEQHIFPNLYFGSSYGWQNSDVKEGSFRSAFAYRPHDGASLAVRWDNPYKQSPSYRAGVGIRPLAWISPQNDYRLELTADLDYAKDGTDYKMFKPILGINTQVLDGIMLGGSYNLETESAYLNFSLRRGSNEVGTVMRMQDNDNYGVAYLHLGEQNFKPFLGLKPDAWYDMKLNGDVVTYKSPKYKLGPISVFDGKQLTIDELIEQIEIASNDPDIKGITLCNPSFSASFALQQELIAALHAYKAGGKKIAVYYDNISNGAYIFAASVADRIYLNPMGSLDLKGIAISSPYLGELLDSLGVEVMNFRSHAYKSAGNMFSEDMMSPAEREMYESLLGSIYEQILDQISTGRGDRLTGNLAELIDNGPYYIATDALEKGLVDALIYEDSFVDQIKEDFGLGRMRKDIVEYSDYSWSNPKTSQIAVIYAQGNIVMGKGTPGQKIAHDTTVRQIRAARNNPDYKGIILRVDSGGGSAQASDIILRELELAQTENDKPVVVSMAGMAASGGYYIACKADRIIADPSTLTGSIGVIGLAFNAQDAFRKIRLNFSTVKMGERADLGSMNRAWTEDEKAIMTNLIEYSYEDFVQKVAAGRPNMGLQAVHQHAQGRVWTGAQALEIGLIDDLGGMETALRHMRELTGITGEIELVDASTRDSGLSITLNSNPLSAVLPEGLTEQWQDTYGKIYELYRDYGVEKVLMLSPINPQSQDF